MRSSLLVSCLILPLSAFAAPISSQSVADTSLTSTLEVSSGKSLWEENTHEIRDLISRGIFGGGKAAPSKTPEMYDSGIPDEWYDPPPPAEDYVPSYHGRLDHTVYPQLSHGPYDPNLNPKAHHSADPPARPEALGIPGKHPW